MGSDAAPRSSGSSSGSANARIVTIGGAGPEGREGGGKDSTADSCETEMLVAIVRQIRIHKRSETINLIARVLL